MISYLGPATAAIITGSVVVEQIFGLPGLGRYFVQGALNRDYTLVMGVVIFYGLLIIGFNLIVDTVYGFIDPKDKTQPMNPSNSLASDAWSALSKNRAWRGFLR